MLKTSLVNLMSYSSAPIAWCRDNLGIGDDSCLVRTQFVGGTRCTRADARRARTDARLARGDARASPHRNDSVIADFNRRLVGRLAPSLPIQSSSRRTTCGIIADLFNRSLIGRLAASSLLP
jgi:hypothetical protein